MNKNISHLYQIAQKESRKIIGLMSGTSLDGLDIALCEISGSGQNTAVKLLEFETIIYSEDIKIEIRKVFAKKNIDFEQLVVLNEWIGILHANMINDALKKWNIPACEVDLIASHGQTVLHAPKFLHQLEKFPNATLQIGDGDHIAVKTGIVTLSDFRQKHIAAGGEGAPLAVYGDYFIFGKKGENRIMLNMGGIANFTYLPASLNPEETFVTDTGTGNTLIDLFVKHNFPEKSYDKDAEIAKNGKVNQILLYHLKDHDFFRQSFPKTIGPELFGHEYVQNAMLKSSQNSISVEDLLATLTRFSAETIAEAIQLAVKNTSYKIEDFKIYISGGGANNPLLVRWLKELLPCHFYKSDDLGISSDAKEAVLFAILANETVSGGAFNFGTKKGIPSVTMGKISLPD
ncbi:anhydro-N-acetylmuramic acid kinase [Flavobacterium sp. Fl-77]|uniref:Anhydro-N-acetylmuramic acid kinase n=1 Tax=Flavobacterium flavipigmentatum TaxID=2893884 RepID=A0AAJ2SJ46_9FLAO|nr:MULTISPECIES: anhydro-N-acetylmuramic acid kinase [unclassified Flavobacterium]MDX6182007.1 anhydro-N-acetylmuramic acid kinase [Flavobacterium sp. Fl-33]MDX6186938.1 anhydro-N-acetylmuramic acid kinase [Flavobacterium sp. Fl-77]UFH37072.1 anhydro-N-acetylmuramic acid kinase [Flavobacterium sp. F-70]